MTDPERLSQRSSGLAAELLRAAAEEQPNDLGMQQTLLALGVSGVLLSSTSAAAAAATTSAVSAGVGAASAGGVGFSSASSVSPLSVTLVIKWLGIGVVGGVSLAGVAAVATGPSTSTPASAASHALKAAPRLEQAPTAPRKSQSPSVVVEEPAPELALSAAPLAPRALVLEPRAAEPVLDVGIPLASEVAYVDRARALLVAGQSSQGLALLERYEQTFREARLLPEVLFLQLEAYQRSGRMAEARGAAKRLVVGFPKSPHAGHARKLLEQATQ